MSLQVARRSPSHFPKFVIQTGFPHLNIPKMADQDGPVTPPVIIRLEAIQTETQNDNNEYFRFHVANLFLNFNFDQSRLSRLNLTIGRGCSLKKEWAKIENHRFAGAYSFAAQYQFQLFR